MLWLPILGYIQNLTFVSPGGATGFDLVFTSVLLLLDFVC